MDTNRPKKIIEGFEQDFCMLSKEFPEKYPTLKLSDFFKYWKSTKLDLIFANRFDPRELLESISELNKFAIDNLADANQLHETRITALYFIACLHAKQPTSFKQKIRLTLHDASNIVDLCQSVAEKSNHDAKLVWYHLRKVDAIDFVESRTVYGPSMLARRRGMLEPVSETKPQDLESDFQKESFEFINDKIDPNVLEIEKIHQQYDELRNALKLNEIDDATVEFESRGSFRDLLDKAKSLIRDYKQER